MACILAIDERVVSNTTQVAEALTQISRYLNGVQPQIDQRVDGNTNKTQRCWPRSHGISMVYALLAHDRADGDSFPD